MIDLFFLILGIKKTVNFSHSATSQRSDFRYSVFSKLAGGEQPFMLFADGKSTGIAALAAQGGVATLTERSDATFSVRQFSSADGE